MSFNAFRCASWLAHCTLSVERSSTSIDFVPAELLDTQRNHKQHACDVLGWWLKWLKAEGWWLKGFVK